MMHTKQGLHIASDTLDQLLNDHENTSDRWTLTVHLISRVIQQNTKRYNAWATIVHQHVEEFVHFD